MGRSSVSARLLAALSSLLALALFAYEARAEEAKGLDPIEPPTLPSLTHRDLTLSFQYTGAGIGEEPATTKGPSATAFAWFTHVDGEYPIVPRKWFAGAAWDLASGAAPGVGRQLLYGNPELWARGIWSNKSGLSAGGSLGVVIPIPRDLGTRGEAVLQTIRVVRPWDSAYFSDSALTARPALDARIVGGPVLFQLRQGLDLSYSFAEKRGDVLARTAAYLGVDVARFLGLGLELFEVYSITAQVTDNKRAAFTFSPSIRFRFPVIQPGISVLLPLNTPLGGAASSFFAIRLHVTLTLLRFGEPDADSRRALPPSPTPH